jgi:hypothetical protein
MKTKCFLDENQAVDSVDFETGNNAEYSVNVGLCQVHLDELEKTEYKFEEKYGAEILDSLYESWR